MAKKDNYYSKNGQNAMYNATVPTLADGDEITQQTDASGNGKVTLATALDKTNDSITTYPVGCTMTVVDTSANTTTVSAAPAYLLGIYVNTVLSAHTVLITDAAVTMLTLPASMAAGTKIDCHSATFATSLIVNPDDSSTGEIVVFWRAA